MNWPALIFLIPAAMFGGMLAYGLKTGRMPAGKATPAAKADDPIAFWILAGLWGVASIGCVVWTVVKAAGL